MSQNGRVILHPIDKPNAFECYFCSISSITVDLEIPDHGSRSSVFEFEDLIITEQDVM